MPKDKRQAGLRIRLRERASRLKADIPAVWLALRHKDTPLAAKLLAGVTICYALSPVDLIPDFIPALGYLDDVILLPALIAWTVSLIPEDVLTTCRQQAEAMWQNGKPTRWQYAIPFVLVWLLVIWLIVSQFL